MAKEDVIKLLDEVRRAEITASIQYMAHHSELENLGVDKLAKQMKREAIEEMRHAESLAERIFFLGGRPSHTPLRDAKDSPDILEMIKQDVELESEAIERLNQGIALCIEETDAGTRKLLEDILLEEEHHLDELNLILETAERMGPAGFMMCVCGSGVPAPNMPQ
ncbi:MAG: ferritin-like domain-containing protein [Planctomycetota bacterium]|jgi:bacterioferritin